MKSKQKPVLIYCDGCCKGNQNEENVGAWAYHIEYFGYIVEDSGIAENTTNNVMELLSCLKALQRINNPKGFSFTVYSDSQYLVKGINEWSKNWIKNNWINAQKKKVENKNLWMELLREIKRFENIEFIQVKGHSNNAGNDRVDDLCNIAVKERFGG